MATRNSTSLTAERAREFLDYDAATGICTRKQATLKSPVGSVVNTIVHQGNKYIRVWIDGVAYPLHRVIWLHVHGRWADPIVDHINGDRTDNRLCNLREATNSMNAQNVRKARASKIIGVLGIYESRCRGKFAARITFADKDYYLGTFDSEKEAAAAYIAAKRLIHLGCTL